MCHFYPGLAALKDRREEEPMRHQWQFARMFKSVRMIGLASISSNGKTSGSDKGEAGAGPRFFEENPRELFTRTWQQQVAREYHSQLSERWWEGEDT